MPPKQEDPLVSSSRREAIVFVLLWTATLAYCVTYCYINGYNRDVSSDLSDMKFYFGWPDWVFWGVVAPWLTCVGISVVIATLVMRDSSLGEDTDVEDAV